MRVIPVAGMAGTRQLGVRSDVLWRLEERGLVRRDSDIEPNWYITDKGKKIIAD
jgi:predicted transcriptional regulator